MKARWRQLRELFASIWRLRPHVRAGRRLVSTVIVTAILAAVLEMLMMSLLAPLVGLILGKEGLPQGRLLSLIPAWLPGLDRTGYLVVFSVGVVGATCAKNAVLYLSSVLGARLRTRVTVNLRHSMFRRLQGAPLTVFEQHPAGEIASVFMNDSVRIMWMTESIVQMIQRTALVLAYVAILLVISWQLTMWTLLLAGVIATLVALILRRSRSLGVSVAEANRSLGAALLESFAGIRVVRATHAERRREDRFLELCQDTGNRELAYLRTQSALIPTAETLGVGGALALMGGAAVWMVHPGGLTPEALAVFAFALLRLLPALNQLYQIQGSALFYSGSVKEVERWLSLPRYPGQPFGTREFTGVTFGIRFDDVRLTYDNGKEALKGVSFEVPAGQTVALVGVSGSGKSSAASLLLRLRAPTSGKVLVDGTDYWEFTAPSWHRAAAVVEQEAFLFHDTLAANVAFGLENVTNDEIESALRLANLMDVVRDLPQGLATVVGERGATLSGGQRQRLAIARALVRNPQILILDEATSALDGVSERLVQSALESATRDRTTLVIAHRLSTIRHAHRIVVLADGAVAEQGTWEELVGRNGAFAELVRGTHPGEVVTAAV
ncbi:MAG: ABC transporter ATP-binding protein [Limisphaerales bacterium]